MERLEPIKPTAAEEYWGWCGTAEAEVSMRCFLCLSITTHLFHDSGEINSEDAWLYEKGGSKAKLST